MIIKNSLRLVLFSVWLWFGGCKAYRQDIMFKLDDNFTSADLAAAVKITERNYRLQKNDLLRFDLYTNKGERVVDPNFELRQGAGNQNFQNARQYQYLVREDGLVKFPMIGDVDIEGLTIYEAEQKLQQLYSQHYIDPYAVLQFENKRVVVLGANGGQVIPLANQSMSILEVIALSGGIQQGAKAKTVRVIRGRLDAPEVFMVDLSTVSGMRASVVAVEPGDVIYIEPWRRAWLETLRDLSPVLSLVSSVVTLALVIQNLNNN